MAANSDNISTVLAYISKARARRTSLVKTSLIEELAVREVQLFAKVNQAVRESRCVGQM